MNLITEFIVTEYCNLDCSYCYMKNTPNFMSVEKVKDYIKNVGKVMKVYGTNKYHISYFGGEPLVNWELIKAAIPMFNADPRCDSQIIITNGLLLTEEIVEYCQANNCDFSWSFDGMWQNDNRPGKNKLDQIEECRKKLPVLKKAFPSLHSSKVMVAPGNIMTMTENLEFFVQDFKMMMPDFTLVRDDIWSGEDIRKFKVESARLADRTIAYIKDNVMAMPGFYQLAVLDMIAGNKLGKRPFGCFAGCNGVGYFPDGNFYPCARFGTGKEFLIMDALGNLNQKNIKTLKNPKISDPRTFDKCKKCKLYNYCNAGCTYSQMKTKDGELIVEPVDSVCELFKIIYNDAIRIHTSVKDLDIYKDYLTNILKHYDFI